jgi:hypothetical protein
VQRRQRHAASRLVVVVGRAQGGLGEEVRQARPFGPRLVGVRPAAEAAQPLELLLGVLRALAREALDEAAGERGLGAGRAETVALGGPRQRSQTAAEGFDGEPPAAAQPRDPPGG